MEDNKEIIKKVLATIEDHSVDQSENGMDAKFNQFFSEQVHKFEADFETEGEQKLEYTDVFNEYVQFYEEQMESLLRTHNLTTE